MFDISTCQGNRYESEQLFTHVLMPIYIFSEIDIHGWLKVSINLPLYSRYNIYGQTLYNWKHPYEENKQIYV